MIGELLYHLINAFDLQPSDAVGSPSGDQKSCSPRAKETNLPSAIKAY